MEIVILVIAVQVIIICGIAIGKIMVHAGFWGLFYY